MPVLTAEALQHFGVASEVALLEGGSQATFRAGDIVLKHISERSLENDHSPQLGAWIAEFSATLEQSGFRVPRGIPTSTGAWSTPDGWTAWTFVAGRHAARSDLAVCIKGINRMHRALAQVPKNALLDVSQTPWARAHRWCLGVRPSHVNPVLASYIDRLYELRRPIETSPYQLIHGDLNPENILVSPSLPPAFIDFTPFWGPPELALAIYANFMGPRQGDETVLSHFECIPNFEQLLLRASLRMLLVMSEFDMLDEWESSAEKRAVEMVLQYLDR